MRGPSAQTASIWWAHNRLVVVRLTCTASIRPSRLQIVRTEALHRFFLRILCQTRPKRPRRTNEVTIFMQFNDSLHKRIWQVHLGKGCLLMDMYIIRTCWLCTSSTGIYGANLKWENWILSGYGCRDSTYSQQDLGWSSDLIIDMNGRELRLFPHQHNKNVNSWLSKKR